MTKITKMTKINIKRLGLLLLVVTGCCLTAAVYQLAADIEAGFWTVLWSVTFILEGYLMCWVLKFYKYREIADENTDKILEEMKNEIRKRSCIHEAPYSWN